MTDRELLRIDKKAMMLALCREHAFSEVVGGVSAGIQIRYEGRFS